MKKIKLGLLALLIGGIAFGATNRVWESQEWLSGHITTPSNPSAGKTKMYFKSDNKLYKLTSGGTETEVGAGSGDLVGPASSTDEAVCRFDGTTGKLAQNSVVGISDTGAVTGVTSLSLSGAISGGTTFSGTGATLSGLTASRALVTDGSKNLASSAVTSTELGYVSGVTSAIQTQIDGKQATDSDLTAVAGLSTTGLVARTGAGTASTRTVTGTANQITVTNGDGVSGNPTLSIPSDPVFPGSGITVATSSGSSVLSGTTDPTETATSGNPGSLYLNTSTGYVYRKTDSGSSTNWVLLSTTAAITGWTQYTPTFTGMGTVSTQSFYYRQVGEDIEIQGRWTTGTVTATEARISLPSVCTSSSAYTTLEIAGNLIHAVSASTFFGDYVLIEPSVTYMTFGQQSSTTNALTKANGNVAFSSTTASTLRARVRCASLASVVNTNFTPIVTGFTAYTPTFTGFGTVSTQSFRYRQIGSGVEVEGVFTAGTSTATEARLSFPTVCASAASDYSTLESVGFAASSTSARSEAVLVEPSVAYFTFGAVDGTNASLVKRNGSTIVSSGEKISFRAFVRCTGMPGVIPAPNLVGLATNNASSAIRIEGATLAAPSAGSCAVTEVGSSDWINGNCTSGATGVCTCTLNSGIFSAAPICQISVTNLAAANSRDEQITSTSTSTIVTFTATTGGTAVNNDVTIMCMGAR